MLVRVLDQIKYINNSNTYTYLNERRLYKWFSIDYKFKFFE